MTLEEASEVWTQTPKIDHNAVKRLIDNHRDSHRNAQIVAWLLFLVIIGFSAANFYGQYFVNHDSLLLASLRAATGLLALGPHYLWVRSQKRQRAELMNSQLDQKDCLRRMVEDLSEQLSPKHGVWAIGYCLLVILMVALTKWLDFVQGGDTAMECVGIVTALVAFFLFVGVCASHHRTEFLIPKRDRLQRLLSELESA